MDVVEYVSAVRANSMYETCERLGFCVRTQHWELNSDIPFTQNVVRLA
jgi:hypothetical protein